MVRRNIEKLHELILYIARQYEDDPLYGKTRLTKVLFWSDFEHYRQTGEAITGSDYIAMPQGPMLENLDGYLTGMGFKNWLTIEPAPSGGPNPLQRPVATREPNLGVFAADELAVIDRIIAEQRGTSAAEVSDLSHEFIGWRAAPRHGERIPYGTALLSKPRLTPELVAYGLELSAQLADDRER
jgi:hypothetical protein